MDAKRGVFTVKVAGIYRLSFTGMFNSQNGHKVTADIIRKSWDHEYHNLGRASAETTETGTIMGTFCWAVGFLP